MDCVIHNFQVRPVHSRQSTKVTRVQYYTLGPQGRHEVLDNSGGKISRRTFEHCTLSTMDEAAQLSVSMSHINEQVFHGTSILEELRRMIMSWVVSEQN